ncbi:hypothetical protein [Defluviimonas salinarum]|uniref:DUF4189 domain-containing protein n=1 Tax=Defluviimonas salinarum TaxID=2992147 RepID=A0ABT3J2M5_9RHOB|nr:hypothetical protein [Defluviimonas salinarum]MCW3781916.1 hypothetical protein [Defluviimonas salinarum]
MQNAGFRGMRVLSAVCALALLAGCQASPEGRALPDDPYGWHGSGKIVRLAELGDSAELRRGFAEMSRGEVYFGALHVDRESERYAYTRSWNSIEAAISVSAAVCSSKSGRACQLAALALPAALPPDTRRAKGFSVQTLNQFRLLYAKVQKPGLWGAYAIAPMAAQGFSAQERTEEDATRGALKDCEFRLEAELARIGPAGAAAARRAGFARCEVVHITSP